MFRNSFLTQGHLVKRIDCNIEICRGHGYKTPTLYSSIIPFPIIPPIYRPPKWMLTLLSCMSKDYYEEVLCSC